MAETLVSGWPLLVAIGCISGLASGLLGIGGGTIIVPALVFVLPALGVNGEVLPMIAIATSIAIIIPTAVASAQQHQSQGTIDWWSLALLAPSIVTGSFAAGYFAHAVHPQLLSLLFVLYALYAARAMLKKNSPVRVQYKARTDSQPNWFAAAMVGISGGALSSLTGMGNAFYAVPFMARFIEMKRAIGTAATLNIPLALAGVCGYVLSGPPSECGGACYGYVYLPAVAAIGITAVLTAPIGARLTQIMPVLVLRRIFGLVLIASAGNLAVKTLPLADAPVYVAEIVKRLQTPAAAQAPVAAAPPACLTDPSSRLSTLVADYGPRRNFEVFQSLCPSPAEVNSALSMIRDRPRLPKNYWIQPVLDGEFPPATDDRAPPKPRPGKRPRPVPRAVVKPTVQPAPKTEQRTSHRTSVAAATCADGRAPGGRQGCAPSAGTALAPAPTPEPKTIFDPFGRLSEPGADYTARNVRGATGGK